MDRIRFVLEEGQDMETFVSPVVRDMLEKEYQFELVAGEQSALLAFCKGFFSILIDDDPVPLVVSDSPAVCEFNDSTFEAYRLTPALSMAQGLVTQLIEQYSQDEWRSPNRYVPAAAIFDYLSMRMHLKEAKEVNVTVHRKGRNGFIRNRELVLS